MSHHAAIAGALDAAARDAAAIGQFSAAAPFTIDEAYGTRPCRSNTAASAANAA